ncbi:MAG TPA: serine/threonine-protein kinase [Ktedonobacterales bacterium]
MSSLAGHQLGDYVLQEVIDQGSMGVVYRAVDITTGQPAAVKVLLDALATDSSFLTRFHQEAGIIAMLQHVNIVRLYTSGLYDGHLYYAMEYVDGMTVGKQLKTAKRLTPAQVVRVGLQVADALAYAYSTAQIIHRDIKPDNLMVDVRWNLKLLDFGLARFEGQGGLTTKGTVVGSLYYVSPEQLLGKPLDGRSDVYALGVSMYEMLTGTRPHTGKKYEELSRSILSGSFPPLHHVEPRLPLPLAQVVERAMASDITQRYQSSAELWHALKNIEGFMQSSPPSLPTPPPVPSGEQAPPDHRKGPPSILPGADISRQGPRSGFLRATTLRPTSTNLDDWPSKVDPSE